MFVPIKRLAVSFRGRMKARIPAQAATPQLALQAAERFVVGPSLVWAAIGHGWGGIIVTVHESCNGSCRMELGYVERFVQLYMGADAGVG